MISINWIIPPLTPTLLFQTPRPNTSLIHLMIMTLQILIMIQAHNIEPFIITCPGYSPPPTSHTRHHTHANWWRSHLYAAVIRWNNPLLFFLPLRWRSHLYATKSTVQQTPLWRTLDTLPTDPGERYGTLRGHPKRRSRWGSPTSMGKSTEF